MNTLYVGDPHVQVSNLADAERLLSYVKKAATGVDRIVFLGDLFHTHAVVRVEVMAFWLKWFKELASETYETIVVVGNHDMTGDHHNRANALSVFDGVSDNLTIVHECLDRGPEVFMAYEHDKDLFVEKANDLAATTGAHTLICHQSFSGSKFENGYFDPNGINPDLLNFKQIISGHIHLGQEFGKVWHPGTPMWLTASDANQTKGIWLVKHGHLGDIEQKTFFDTAGVVTPIVSVQWKEGDTMPELPAGARTTVEMVGSSEWVANHRKDLTGTAIKTTITQQVAPRKAGKNFQDFVENEFDLVTGVDRSEFIQFLQRLSLV